MALLCSSPFLCNSLIHTSKCCHAISRPSITEALTITPIIVPTVRSLWSSEKPTRHHSLQITCCNTSSGLSMEISQSPSAGVFIKGLPRSTSEGRLEKVFSQFGEVNQVKICRDRETKESLGYGYLWFSSKESTASAIEEMNGKFFDGRFIFVTAAKPQFTKRRRTKRPYKF